MINAVVGVLYLVFVGCVFLIFEREDWNNEKRMKSLLIGMGGFLIATLILAY